MDTIRVCESQDVWDDYVLEQGGHPLQLWGWGELKSRHNWSAVRVQAMRGDTVIGAAQVLVRRLPWPFRALAYVPRGPIADTEYLSAVLEAVARHVKDEYRAAVVTIEPDLESLPELDGWQRSTNRILMAETLVLDLTQSDDDLQAAMTKKTRQYIRKSTRAVAIRQVKTREELDACLEVYRQTAERAGFALHDDAYYYDVFEQLGDHSPVFAALDEGRVVAFLWLAISSQTAFELYGGMDETGQRLRANYALKWHAIQATQRWGLERYDMNGLVSDGVSAFKQGFASHETDLVGTYDKPLSPLYGVWSRALPAVKRVLRRVKR